MRNNKPFNNEYYRRLDYINKLYSNEDELLKNIRQQCLREGRNINISMEDGQLLAMLAKISGAKNILEIGTLFGYSTLWFAKGMGKNGKITTIERDKYECSIARDNFKKSEYTIELLEGDALKTLEKLVSEYRIYDICFIDADKINYINYLKFADKLVKSGGLIIADNTMLSGLVCRDYLPNDKVRFFAWQNMKDFNRELANREKYETVMLNNDDGISVVIKK